MNVLGSRIAIAGTLLMLSAISGVIVSSLGRPLNTAVFAVLVVLTLQRNFGMGPASHPALRGAPALAPAAAERLRRAERYLGSQAGGRAQSEEELVASEGEKALFLSTD